ncbi:MAG: biotin/lipoyl-containing protein [Ignisphaera sp.]
MNNKRYDVEIFEEQKNTLRIKIGSKEYIVHVVENDNNSTTQLLSRNTHNKVNEQVGIIQKSIEIGSSLLEENVIFSEIPGRILKILVSEGDRVSMGDTIAVVESMKMEIEIKSPRSGIVKKILVKDGSYVNVGQPIILLG